MITDLGGEIEEEKIVWHNGGCVPSQAMERGAVGIVKCGAMMRR
jgi:hypothetical protein